MAREDFFRKKNIHWGTNFGKQNFGGIVLYGETIMIRFFQGKEVSQNAFSSNLDTVNLAVFPN